MFKQFICSLTTSLMILFFYTVATAEPVKIIFDTDMDTDCDDAGALAVLHELANQGEADILATVVSSHFQWSAACVDAINTYYNRPDLPIGAPKKPGADTNRGSRYAKQITERFPTDLKTNDDVPDAVEVYRRILAEHDDNSVVIVTVGYLTNIAYLLESEPDDYSSLTGKELVDKKVKQWVCMGGRFPKHLDPRVFGNFKPDPKAAVKASTDWPGVIVFSGLGNDILTGHSLKETPDSNPVKVAYKLYLGDTPARPSWDLIATLYAVRPDAEFWQIHEQGYNHILDNGTNEWRDEDKYNHHLLQLKSGQKQALTKKLEDLMSAPPEK